MKQTDEAQSARKNERTQRETDRDRERLSSLHDRRGLILTLFAFSTNITVGGVHANVPIADCDS